MRVTSEPITRSPDTSDSERARRDLPLAGGPQTITVRGARARHARRSPRSEQLARVADAVAQERDLGPHPGPDRRVKGDHLIRSRVSARGAVGVDQHPAQVGTPETLEVHEQEGEIGADVDLAQPGIELRAVDDLHLTADQHVFGAEIAVAVAHQPSATRAASVAPCRARNASVNRWAASTRPGAIVPFSSSPSKLPSAFRSTDATPRAAARDGAPAA